MSTTHTHDHQPTNLRRHIREDHSLLAGGKLAYLTEYHARIHDRDDPPRTYHSDRLGAVTIPEDEPRTAEDAWVEERLRIEQP